MNAFEEIISKKEKCDFMLWYLNLDDDSSDKMYNALVYLFDIMYQDWQDGSDFNEFEYEAKKYIRKWEKV
jgi:hypothetical protein